MNKQLGLLVALNLDMDLFFSVSITNNDIRILGDYTQDTRDYLLLKGFEKFDYLYADNDLMLEYKYKKICITLQKNY